MRSLSLVGYKQRQCGRITSRFDLGMGLALYNGQNIWFSFALFFSYVLVLSGKELILFMVACAVFCFRFEVKGVENTGMF